MSHVPVCYTKVTYGSCQSNVTYGSSNVTYDSSVTLLMTRLPKPMTFQWHDSFKYVTCSLICDITHDTTPKTHDIPVTWLIHVRDVFIWITHMWHYSRHDSPHPWFIYVTQLFHTHDSYTWTIHICHYSWYYYGLSLVIVGSIKL